VTRIVFDPLGEADFGHHFQIEAGALLDALLFDRLVFLAVKSQPFAQLLL